MVTCCWVTEEARELGQKRCRGRVWGVFFLLLGVSEELASSMGWRIRRRALINLETESQSEAIWMITLSLHTVCIKCDNSPVVNLQQCEVGLQGNLFLLIFCRIGVLGGTKIRWSYTFSLLDSVCIFALNVNFLFLHFIWTMSLCGPPV